MSIIFVRGTSSPGPPHTLARGDLLLNGGDPCTPPSSLRYARSSQLAPLPFAYPRSALSRRSGEAAKADRVARSLRSLALGLILRQEVLARAGNAVLVGPPVRFRGHEEIAVRGRRGRRPLDRRSLPRVLLGLLPLP